MAATSDECECSIPDGWSIRSGRDVLRSLERILPESCHAADSWNYYEAIEGRPIEDLTVVAFKGDRPISAVVATGLDEEISFFRRPALIENCAPANESVSGRARAILARILARAATRRGLTLDVMHIRESGDIDGEQALFRTSAGRHVDVCIGHVDLQMSLEDIWRSTRKSYRASINRGRALFQTTVMDARCVDHRRFAEFRLLHERVAGRVTRSAESWDVMLKEIESGSAELVTIDDHDALVGATFTRHSSGISLYATGVYDRDRFSQPIAHWPLHHSILRAKERGDHRFVLGDVDISDQARTEKERNIAMFKRGFMTGQSVYRRFVISPEELASDDSLRSTKCDH